jgi:RHS repeat-associated protein
MNTQLSYNYYTHATQNPENFGWLSGYTEHKHLDEFALINMFSEDFDFVSISETKSLAELIPIATVWSVSGNGRIYDPVLGRMLSPDNFVQSPYNSQSYNRYSYVWNNPLKYSDPSGEWVQYAIGAVVGGYTGYKIGRAKGARREQLFYYTVGGAAIGVATAGIGSYVNGAVAGGVGGSATSVGAISAGTAGLASGFFAGVSYSFLAGADPKEALIAGAKSAAISGITAALIGGMIAVSNDRNFLTGKSPYYEATLEGYELIWQDGEMDCKNAACASIEKLNGGKRTQKDFIEIGNKFLNDNPNNASLNDYFENAGFRVKDPFDWDYKQIGKSMELGNPIVIDKYVGVDRTHTITITKIRQWSENSDVKVWFSDPQQGVWRASWNSTVGNSSFNKGAYLFWLR